MRRTALILIAMALVLSACTGDTTESSPTTTEGAGPSPTVVRPPRPIPGVLASQTLVQFDACDDFLDYVIEHALELVGPYGLQNGGYGYPVPMPGVFFEGDVRAETAGAAPQVDAPASAPAPAPVEGVDFSGTNVQELGVDEPDIVKTDGRRIIALSEQTLFVIDVTGDNPKLIGKISLQDVSVRDLFLHGDRVLALGGGYGNVYYGGIVPPDGYYPTPISKVVEIDISSDEPFVARTLEFDGTYISARLVGDSARVVLTSAPTGFVWAFPEGGGLKAERDAEDENREIIKNSTIDNWVPYFVLTNAAGDVIDEGSMVDCDRARHPVEFAGLDLLSVMSIDLGRGLRVADATGVLASGQTVYASTENLYVATQRWVDWRVFEENAENADFEGVSTQIHQFDISDETKTEYVASGSVTGFLLNQFAMSEHEGRLRVASTTEPEWRRWGDFEQESMVTVLEADGGELVAIGMVDGLGKGERIYSVRFIEDTAFVVTFRQTDPLYTVDLSDPTNPEVLGELKILGYSAYLHPLGDDLLLGIGQDADERGRTEGTQISIFDVSDLKNPERIAQMTLAKNSNSSVEYDHRAFLYWEPADLAVIPIQRWSWEERPNGEGKEEVFFGAIGIDIGGGDINEVGPIVHPGGASDDGMWDYMAQIQRSLVIGDDLYTVSMKGLLRSDLDTLEDEVFLNFWN
jgi:uncharacterized secreted protein with C-terminal beta-propeller domain